MNRLLAYILGGLSLLLFYPANAAKYYVKPIKAGTANGSSWANAFGNAEFASKLISATAGDEFHLAAGTYYPLFDAGGSNTTNENTRTFIINNGVKIQGGYTANPLQTEVASNDYSLVILSGDIGVSTNVTDNVKNVVTVAASAKNVSINSISISGGYGGGTGGGIYINASTDVVLNYVLVSDNKSTSRGGGIYCNGSLLTINNSKILRNTSGTRGGGIDCIGSAAFLRINNSEIGDNKLTDAGSGWGGGIHTESASSEIKYSYIHHNKGSDGGGFHNTSQSNATLVGCIFEYNTAANLDGGGLNLYNGTGLTTMDSCIVRYNEATGTYGGGGILRQGGNLILRNSAVYENTSKVYGGGIATAEGAGTITIINTSISGNTCVSGGGAIYRGAGTLSIINSTIVGNSSDKQIGGIYGSVSTLRNSIVSNNKSGGLDSELQNSPTTATYNIIGSNYYISGVTTPQSGTIFNAANHLGLLQDNGGFSFTHALIGANNPAKDKGDPTILTDADTKLHYDQRGIKRVFPSIGAYEFVIKAVDDYFSTVKGSSALIDILRNDIFLADCTPVISIKTAPSNGVASVVSGKIKYTPNTNFTGSDVFTYTIDCLGYTSEANVYFMIMEMPDNISDINCYVKPTATTWDIKEVASSQQLFHMYALPLVGDIDNDGKNEIVGFNHDTHQTSTAIVILDNQLNKLRSFTVPKVYCYGAYPMVLMRTKSGTPLIVIATGYSATASDSYRLIAYDAMGVQKWRSVDQIYPNTTAWQNYSTSLVVADINGDGNAEILANNKIYNAEDGTLIVTLPAGGTGLHTPYGATSSTQMPVLADVDNDGVLEVVAGNTVYKVNIAAKTASVYRSITGTNIQDGFTSVADIDLDGYLDVVVTTLNGTNAIMYAWSPYNNKLIGTVQTKAMGGTGGPSRAFIGDYNNDGYPEIAFSYRFGRISYRYDSSIKDFKVMWDKTTNDGSGATTLSVFDFNQDGFAELVYRDEQNLVVIDGISGDIIPGSQIPCTSGTATEYPIVVDLDKDGHADILVSSSPGINPSYIKRFGSKTPGSWAPARPVWNQHAFNAVNVNDDLSIPRFQLNPATVFPGNDGALGTTDDVRPFNAFLQQQTILNKNGTLLFPTPDYILNSDWSISKHQGDSVTIHFCVENKGDANGLVPFYATLYKDGTLIANAVATSSFNTVPTVGQAAVCYNWVIKNFSSLKLPSSGEIVLSVNDNGKGAVVQPECNTGNGKYPKKIEYMIMPTDDFINVVQDSKNNKINVLNNDVLGICNTTNAIVELVTLPINGNASIVDNKVVYTPNSTYKGADKLEYRVKDCNDPQQTVNAWVYITVLEIPDNIADENCFVKLPAISNFSLQQLKESSDVYPDWGAIIAGDVDGDNDVELILAKIESDYNSSNVLDILDKDLKLKYSITTPSFRNAGNSFTIANVDKGKYAAIFVATVTRQLVKYTFDGTTYTEQWSKTYSDNTFYDVGVPIVTDIDGDGNAEVIVYDKVFDAQTGTLLADGGFLGTGTKAVNYSFGLGGHNTRTSRVQYGSMMVAADVDGDNLPEIIAGDCVYKVTITNRSSATGNTFTLLQRADKTGRSEVGDGATAVADMDLDGKLDVVVTRNISTATGVVYIWNPRTGEIMNAVSPTVPVNNNQGINGPSVASIGNFDDDAYPEIVLNGYRVMKAYDFNPATKELKERWSITTTDDSASGAVALFDFDQDGKVELVYRDQTNFKIINGVTGQDMLQSPISIRSSTANEAPLIVDMNNDGVPEIVFVSSVGGTWANAKVRMYGSASSVWAPTRAVWNQYNYNGVNVNNNLTIPRYQMNPATIFSGADGILGTADDTRPYNAFMQQWTTINKDGLPHNPIPDYAINQPWTLIRHQGDSATIHFCMENKGSVTGPPLLYVTLYKTATRAVADVAAIGTIKSPPHPGESRCYDCVIYNYSTLPIPTSGEVLLSINDKGTGTFVVSECDETNNTYARKMETLLTLFDDAVSVLKGSSGNQINILVNDFFAGCSTNNITLELVTQPQHGTVSMTSDKRLSYTPNSDYTGADKIEYRVKDCNNPMQESTAWVYITVVDIPDNFSDANCTTLPPGSPWGIHEEKSISDVATLPQFAVGDLDGDGKPEIVAFTAASDVALDKVAIFKGPEFKDPLKITLPEKFDFNYGVPSIAIGRIKSSDTPVQYTPIVFVVGSSATKKAYLIAYNAITGEQVWLKSVGFSATNNNKKLNGMVGLADFNGDGWTEVYVGNQIYDATTGQLLCDGLTNNVGGTLGIITTNTLPAVADIIGDSRLELIAGNQIYDVNITSRTNPALNSMKVVKTVTPPVPNVADGFTTVADFNNDGKLEVLVRSRNGNDDRARQIHLYLWTPHGAAEKILAATTETRMYFGCPFIGDLDNDGIVEIVSLGSNGTITSQPGFMARRYNPINGAFDNLWDINHVDQSGGTAMTLFDFNQDGAAEIVYRDEKELKILNASTGTPVLLKSYPCFSETFFEYPVVADIFGDGHARILVTSDYKQLRPFAGTANIKIYSGDNPSDWAPARKVWNQYAYNGVNVNNDLTIPRYPLSVSSIFPGVDGVMGTSDDVRPYNGFLIQQTTLGKNGVPLFLTPDYSFNPQSWTMKRHLADTATIHFCVQNTGDATGPAPLFVSLYKGGDKIPANLIAVDSFKLVVPVGQTQCYDMVIRNASSKIPATGELLLSINDRGKGTLVTPECDGDNNTSAQNVETLLILMDDATMVIKNSVNNTIDVLNNDMLAGCTSNNVTVQIVTPPTNGTVTLDANNRLVYSPNSNYLGTDKLEYRLTDCNSPQQTATAWVSITVIEMPDNIDDISCYVTKGGNVWGIRQTSKLGSNTISNYFPPLVGDLDNDGKPEIVIPSQHGTVLSADNISTMNVTHRLQYISVFSGKDGSRIERTTKKPFNPIGAGMIALGRAKYAGVDTGMIVVAEANLYLRAYDRQMNLLWVSNDKWTDNTSTYASRSGTSVGFADFNGDGAAEIYAGNRIFNASTGALLCKGTGNFGNLTYNEVNLAIQENAMTAVANILGDSRLELVAGSQVYEVAPDLSSMKVVAELTTINCIEDPSLVIPKDGFTQVIDIDNDGMLEVLVQARITTGKHFIYLWSPAKGKILAQKLLLNTDKIGVPFIGDIDGKADKLPEILFIGSNFGGTPANNKIYAFKYVEGNDLLSEFWTLPHTDDSGFTGLTLFDFNQDGVSEIVYRDMTQLRIINGSQNPPTNLATFACYSGTGYEYPTIADIDGDGAAEILISGGDASGNTVNGSLQIFKSQIGAAWAPARKVWNQYTYNVVNVNNDLTIPRYPLSLATVFPGNDGILGTADDVRPFNAFLQQQTVLNKNGTLLFPTPDYVLNSDWTIYKHQGDSISIHFCVENKGSINGSAPFHAALYKGNDKIPANLIGFNSMKEVPAVGQTLCYTMVLKNVSSKMPNSGELLLSINDKGDGVLVVPECDVDNNTRTQKIESMLVLMDDVATVLKNSVDNTIDVLNNDILAGCTSNNVIVQIITPPTNGIATLNGNNLMYNPNTDYLGADKVEYRVTDCNNPQQTATAWAYIVVVTPQSQQYVACPKAIANMGMAPIAGVNYQWYDAPTGGTIVSGGANVNTLKITKNSAADIGSWWVEPTWNGLVFPRVQVDLLLGTNCGSATPTDCAVNGTLLWKEDFDSYGDGLNPASTVFSAEGLPAGRTTYPFWNGTGPHPLKPTDKAVYPLDGEYSLMKYNINLSGWYFYDDHTSPTNRTIGRTMLVNAALNPGIFYSHTIDGLCSNTDLLFSVWVANVTTASGYSKPNMRFVLTDVASGVVLKDYYTGDLAVPVSGKTSWQNFGCDFKVPEGVTSVKLEIFNNGGGGSGNDFVMDDIEIYLCAPKVKIDPDKDMLVCEDANLELKLKEEYNGTSTFGGKVEYVWQRKLQNMDNWENIGLPGLTTNGIINNTSPSASIVVNNVSELDEGYYRFVLAAQGNLNNINCRAASDSVYISVRKTLVIEDIRVQICPDFTAGAKFNLSSYLFIGDYGSNWSVEWSNITLPPNTPIVNDPTLGTVNMNFTQGTHKYKYKIKNECFESTANMYVTTIGRKLVNLPPEQVVVCKDFATDINIDQIIGIEVKGQVDAINIDPKYIKKLVPPSLFAGAIVLNGAAVWADNAGDAIDYNGVPARLVKLTYTTASDSCLGTQVFHLDIIITDEIVN